jgi:hypothetical protein
MRWSNFFRESREWSRFFFGVNDEPVAGDESGVRPKFDTGDGRDVGAWAGCGIGG